MCQVTATSLLFTFAHDILLTVQEYLGGFFFFASRLLKHLGTPCAGS